MHRILPLLIVLTTCFGYSQSKFEIETLIDKISKIENSKDISKTKPAEQIMAFGEKSLPILAEFFLDTTRTNVKSECINRNLKKGEIAIIMADRIEMMPFAHLTGIQNCLMTFCENNPNLIEFYLPWIRQKGYKIFQKNYVNWLYDRDRMDWLVKLKGKARKERRKMIRQGRKKARGKQR